ncbi:hypothetical protein [Sediminimonas qiaohouensis]|uniref:hypothetical protein n=1 Tax=Sediminimonas qiaohouensis TaxID=552061 RepID=UPI000685DC05|nr:hypothetical protein [Sediminimonas qiaohouensis]
MYLRLNDLRRGASPVPRPDPLRRVFTDKQDALSNAAGLLAGDRGLRLVETIAEALQRGAGRSQSTRTVLRDLLGVLSLEHVHDDTRPEAGFFADIDPEDPVVEEICLLTDELRDAIERADAAPVPASRFGAVA